MFMSDERRERGGGERDGDREIEKLKETDRERERETEVAGRGGKGKSRGGRTYICICLACCPCSLLLLSWLFQTGNTDLLCHIRECSVPAYLHYGYLTRWSQVSSLPRLIFGLRDGAVGVESGRGIEMVSEALKSCHSYAELITSLTGHLPGK